MNKHGAGGDFFFFRSLVVLLGRSLLLQHVPKGGGRHHLAFSHPDRFLKRKLIEVVILYMTWERGCSVSGSPQG